MEINKLRLRLRPYAIFVSLLLLLGTATMAGTSCRRESEIKDSDPRTEYPSNTNENSGMQMVDVELADYMIVMPSVLEAGAYRFNVSNTGQVEHNLRIEGQGIEQELEDDLDPGEQGTIDIRLEPGTYRVYCPIDNHASMGMDLMLTVREMDDQMGDEGMDTEMDMQRDGCDMDGGMKMDGGEDKDGYGDTGGAMMDGEQQRRL